MKLVILFCKTISFCYVSKLVQRNIKSWSSRYS